VVALLDHQDDPDRKRALNDALDARNTEGWSAVTTFMDHAPVLHAIEDAARHSASADTARVTAAQARSTTTVPAPRPGPRLPPSASSPPPGLPTRPSFAPAR
jgi:hypothetical protein